ncbi:hypothetical protein IMSAGC019_01587 [Lachnospiraceae bacterium]|nr:hypothetical protein IMSAGC019_01587 [Lachnospiraceae bacterium]
MGFTWIEKGIEPIIYKIYEICRTTAKEKSRRTAEVYPKLFTIYKELKRQNEIIFEAEKERSVLERLKNPPKKAADYQQQSTVKNKDRGAG